jgi:hypothetical protein
MSQCIRNGFRYANIVFDAFSDCRDQALGRRQQGDRQCRNLGESRASRRKAHPDNLGDQEEKVEEVTNVNFNLSVGTAVPAGGRYYPMPARVVEIYPEWRGYDFILVQGGYIVLRPRTHEIVYIIEG